MGETNESTQAATVMEPGWSPTYYGKQACQRTTPRSGAAWLKANQRASGRWFTRSLNADRAHYVTHAGSAWALLALKACE